MRNLKSEIIHAIYQCSGVNTEKLVEVSNICDRFQTRLDTIEGVQKQSGEAPSQQLKPEMPSFDEFERWMLQHGLEDITHGAIYQYFARHIGR